MTMGRRTSSPRFLDNGLFMSRVFRFAALVFALTVSSFARAADAPPGALSCSGCHPNAAGVETPAGRIIGLSASDISAAMTDYRAGKRPASIMDRIAKGFSDDEIAAIAAWYAARKN
jgi:sulfide dehydrogenase cytochrome subunit